MENLLPLLITIVGAFISLGLVANAFFLKAIFSDLHAVKVNIAQIFERSKSRDEKEKNHSNRIESLEKRYDVLQMKIQKLELSSKGE